MYSPSPTVADRPGSMGSMLRPIPQETAELKAAYISLAPNDERPHPDNGSVEALSAAEAALAQAPVLQIC